MHGQRNIRKRKRVFTKCARPFYVPGVQFPNIRRRGTDLYPWPVLVRYVVGEVTLGQVSHPVLLFPPVSIIAPMFHAHSLVNHHRCMTLAVHSVVK